MSHLVNLFLFEQNVYFRSPFVYFGIFVDLSNYKIKVGTVLFKVKIEENFNRCNFLRRDNLIVITITHRFRCFSSHV